MNSHVYWIGVAVLVGVGLIVPIQAEEGSLDVATLHRGINAVPCLAPLNLLRPRCRRQRSRWQRNGWIGATPTPTDA